jgi:DNA replication and repair protein RecF
MRIKTLSLKNFRSHAEFSTDFTNDFVVFHGPNAAGKTNLVEAIYFLSVFKSLRDGPHYMFTTGTANVELRAVLERDGRDYLLEVFLEERDGKTYANFKLDGVRKNKRMVQNMLSAVVFDPTDVDLMNESADQRRRYLNMVLAQKRGQYIEDLHNYKKVLTQKNQLLQNIRAGEGSMQELTAWNEQQAMFGSSILAARLDFVSFVNERIGDVYAQISGVARPILLEYRSTVGGSFKMELYQQQEREVAAGVSLIGPHRDDAIFVGGGGTPLAPLSSRGEMRSQILALKIIELAYLAENGENPVLLLDDVLSELDDDRKVFLIKYIQGKFQTFITTTVPIEMQAQHVRLG